MKKFYNWIVSHPRLVITVFVIASLVCAVCKGFVRVDYDMNDYLPEDSASTVALDLMEQEFGGDPQSKLHRLLDFTHQPRDIDDPWYTGDFVTAYNDIAAGCNALLDSMFPNSAERKK